MVEGCHELSRLLCKFSAEQEARIGDSKQFDHVSLDWLKHVSLDLDPNLPFLPVPPPSSGCGGTGRESGGGTSQDQLPGAGPEVAPPRAEWPDLHVWPARGHAILEAPVSDPSGKPQGSIALCTTCGSVCAVGGHGGKTALASDCLGYRSPGRERQLAWILQGRHPGKKGFVVSRATVLSDYARAHLSGKMGLDDPPALVPPRGSLAASSSGGGRGGTGVDLVRGLALFGFSSRAEAESLGARARERRRREPPPGDLDP